MRFSDPDSNLRQKYNRVKTSSLCRILGIVILVVIVVFLSIRITREEHNLTRFLDDRIRGDRVGTDFEKGLAGGRTRPGPRHIRKRR